MFDISWESVTLLLLLLPTQAEELKRKKTEANLFFFSFFLSDPLGIAPGLITFSFCPFWLVFLSFFIFLFVAVTLFFVFIPGKGNEESHSVN